ncbi:MAG: MBL fold metallo-hydrolase [Bauldia sp.]|nr:MBL fold metallo-hydrolase [Bauldia sp.]
MRLGRGAGALLAALALAGCAATARHHGSLDPPRYHNTGTRTQSVATHGEWTRHLVRMQLGMFPEAGKLPPDHVLSREGTLAGLAKAEQAKVAVTWIGHATALIRMNGTWILTDPAMRETVGAGPLRLARLAPPMPAIEDLPPIDLILISHGDYDHLDVSTLRRLAIRNPDAIVLAPQDNARLLRSTGFRTIVELAWFERRRLDGLTVEAVPAVHGLRRVPEPHDSAHWAGWVIRDGGTALYFAGDTGFGSVFETIRARSGRVDYALVPIGAYAPRRLEAPYHVTPEEAADIARILGARVAVGVHWGTFPLSEEAPVEQRARFLAAAGGGLHTVAPRVGETIVLVP